MTLVNKNQLLQQLFDQKIKKISTPLKIKKIEASKHKSAQFTELSFFLPGENNERKKVYNFFKCELHLVEDFRANILIGNNILALESFVLHIRLSHIIMGSYGIKITIRA